MNNLHKIYQRLYSFCAYNLLLYANFLLLFGFALHINNEIIITIATKLFPAYLLIGIGGYLLNDIFDIRADTLSEKFNITNLIKPYLVLILILFFWLSGFYLIYSTSKQAVIILIFQFLLLLGYSVPYIRLKEKGFLGIITDALYAHVIPAIILLFLLQKYSVVPMQLWVSFIVLTFLLGLRDIAIHQLEDVEKDIESNTMTFAVKNSKTVQNLIYKLNVTAAFTLSILLFFIQFTSNIELFFGITLLLPISYTIFFYKYSNTTKDILIGNYVLLSSILFLYLQIESENYIGIIFLLHPYFLQKTRSLFNWLQCTFVPLIVNYSLYYFFLVLGRNLKYKPLYKNKITLKKNQE